jgi:hypothetical protein
MWQNLLQPQIVAIIVAKEFQRDSSSERLSQASHGSDPNQTELLEGF